MVGLSNDLLSSVYLYDLASWSSTRIATPGVPQNDEYEEPDLPMDRCLHARSLGLIECAQAEQTICPSVVVIGEFLLGLRAVKGPVPKYTRRRSLLSLDAVVYIANPDPNAPLFNKPVPAYVPQPLHPVLRRLLIQSWVDLRCAVPPKTWCSVYRT